MISSNSTYGISEDKKLCENTGQTISPTLMLWFTLF
ncbi:UNVERIFIED_CONTAM: hypothetical protein GTU68_019103 [Idotea baltica]|nr:hypothetical protein [Idotea baltica]